jgi:protein-tyrosine phosphatase
VIDLHAHVLPGVDDGAPDLDAAVRLARLAAADGVAVMAATPHLRADHPRVIASELPARVQRLRDELARAGVAIEIVSGAEVDVFHAVKADEEELRLASYGQRGTDVLIETPYGSLPHTLEDMLFRLEARGYRILLAHPERSRDFRLRPRRLMALVKRGTLIQVTAGSLAGRRRSSSTRRFAEALVAEGVAHVIASDDHGGSRASLVEGVAAAAFTDAARAEWMVTEAPAAILAGDVLPPAPPPTRARRRRLAG